uniref:Uncharacterized protein n=1 Tax=Rhizophora mucronata TaxID=61149 RepID=A0A2P2IH78_RHIMU
MQCLLLQSPWSFNIHIGIVHSHSSVFVAFMDL